MSDYIDRNIRAFGRLLGTVDAATSQLLTTTDLAEVRRVAEHLLKVAKECEAATNLDPTN